MVIYFSQISFSIEQSCFCFNYTYFVRIFKEKRQTYGVQKRPLSRGSLCCHHMCRRINRQFILLVHGVTYKARDHLYCIFIVQVQIIQSRTIE